MYVVSFYCCLEIIDWVFPRHLGSASRINFFHDLNHDESRSSEKVAWIRYARCSFVSHMAQLVTREKGVAVEHINAPPRCPQSAADYSSTDSTQMNLTSPALSHNSLNDFDGGEGLLHDFDVYRFKSRRQGVCCALSHNCAGCASSEAGSMNDRVDPPPMIKSSVMRYWKMT